MKIDLFTLALDHRFAPTYDGLRTHSIVTAQDAERRAGMATDLHAAGLPLDAARDVAMALYSLGRANSDAACTKTELGTAVYLLVQEACDRVEDLLATEVQS